MYHGKRLAHVLPAVLRPGSGGDGEHAQVHLRAQARQWLESKPRQWRIGCRIWVGCEMRARTSVM
jgi:hypothetical protein